MFRSIFVGASWLIVLSWSLLIVLMSVPYYLPGIVPAFIAERPEVTNDPVWRAALLTHIVGGVICLLSGPLLVWNLVLRKSKRLHRWLGWIYVVAVLGWGGPTGIYLSLSAKGGAWGVAGFLVTGIAWIGVTAAGLQTIRAGKLTEHIRWMIRSYALTVSAVFFRLFYLAFYLSGASETPSYILSIWFSFLASIAVGEYFVVRSGKHELRELATSLQTRTSPKLASGQGVAS